MSISFRRFAVADEEYLDAAPAGDVHEPPTCSYCGGTEFEPQEHNGRALRSKCSTCGGTMVSSAGQFQPDLIGSPHNHPKQDADPASGGVGGAGSAPVVLTTNDLASRTAATDWCRHRHAEHCWLPNREAAGPIALYPPQDRGICPWTTASQQQINCPVSEPGPMAGMGRAAKGGRPKPQPLKRGLGPSHDPSRCPVCKQKGTGPVKHQAAPLAAPHRNPTGASSWYHGTDFDPSEDWEHVEEHQHIEPPKTDLTGSPFGTGKPYSTADPGGRLKTPERHAWGVGSHAGYHWNTDLGTHFTSLKHVANDLFAQNNHQSRVAHADIHMANPAHYGSEEEMGAHAINWAREQGHRFLPEGDHAHHAFIDGNDHKLDSHSDDPDDDDFYDQNKRYAHVGEHIEPHDEDMRSAISHVDKHGVKRHQDYELSTMDRYISTHPDREKITEGFREHLQSKGHDGIVYGNSIEGPKGHSCAIAFPGTHVQVKKWEWKHPESRHHVPTDNRAQNWNQHSLLDADPRTWPKAAALDAELRFHFVSAWADVRAKAKRIRAEGGVSVVVASLDGIGGHVQGDTGVYETILNYAPGSAKVANWTCGCAWAAYAWNRSPAYRRFEGRMCSHALALQFEAQSRGMFGRSIAEDTVRPSWMRDKVRQRYDRDTGVHDLVHASLVPSESRFSWHVDMNRQAALDPEGVYPTDHGLDLERPPLYAVALTATWAGKDPAATLQTMLDHGMEHAAARALLHEAIGDAQLQDLEQLGAGLQHAADLSSGLEVEAALPGPSHVTRCPDCGAEVSSHANRCPKCGAHLNEGETGDLHLAKVAVADPDDDVWWHGTPTGDLRGGRYGLHVGTHKAASEAVTARIGHPVHGVWDGTRTYGETLLAGKKTLHARKISVTGHNCNVPDHDHLPDPDGHFPHDSHVTPESKPDIFPLHITGHMANSPHEPYRDAEANSLMQRSRGNHGYYYRNVAEDGGSISAVVPHQNHIERIGHNEPHVDYHNADQYHKPLTDSDYDYDDDEFDDHHHGAKKDEPLAEPTHAGVVLKAQDTGRILMIQRSHKDPDDPAAGTWEFPGGGREENDAHSLHSGIREFEEETGQPFPLGGHVQHVWRSSNGVYQGHVVVVPSEDAVNFGAGRATVNPDDPDGDDHEQSTWWDPEHARKNPALRPECKDAPWGHIKAATLQSTSTYSTNDLLADPELGDYRPKPPQRPMNSDDENPGSTGFATAGDPPEFDQQLSTQVSTTPFAASLWQAVLNDEPESALPVAEADMAEETPGERFRSQMTSETDYLAMPPTGQHTAAVGGGTTAEIVASFQATAAGKMLADQKGPDDVDIASAARAYLSGEAPGGPGIGKTALKDFSFSEQQELIGEGAADGTRARNLPDLQIEGTHYQALQAALDAQGATEDTEDLFV